MVNIKALAHSDIPYQESKSSFACRQTAIIQDGTCLTDAFTAAAPSLVQLSDSRSLR